MEQSMADALRFVADTLNLDRYEVIEFPDRQRLAKNVDCRLPSSLQPRDEMGSAIRGRLLWRGWATDPVTALHAAEWPQ